MRKTGVIANATMRTSAILLLRLLAQAGTLLTVATLLGAERFGAFAGICALAVLFGSLATLGTHIRLLRDVSRDERFRNSSVTSALGTTLAAGTTLLVLYLALCAVAFQTFGIPTWVILAVGISEITLYPFITLAAAEHQASRRVAYSQFLIILPLLLRLCAATGILLAMNPHRALGVYAATYLAGMLISLAIGIRSLPDAWPRARNWRILKRSEWREASGFSALAFSSKSSSELDKILAAQLLTLPAASAYIVAARIVGASSLPVAAMMLSVLPRLFKESLFPSRSRLPLPIFAASLGYGLLAGALLWMTAPLMPAILGREYSDSGTILRLLSVAAPLLSLRISASNLLMAAHGPWKRFTVELCGSISLPIMAMGLQSRLAHNSLLVAYIGAELLMAAVGWLLIIQLSNRPAPSGAVANGENH